MDERLIQVQAATRIACLRMTAAHLKALHDIVDHASCLPARSEWDRKAAAHAKIFGLLAEVADDPAMAAVLAGAVRSMQGLMLAAGRKADGMIASSRQRLLACLRARDADGAALEMEQHLRGLHFMSRLAQRRREAYERDGHVRCSHEVIGEAHALRSPVPMAQKPGPRTRDMCNTSRGGGE